MQTRQSSPSRLRPQNRRGLQNTPGLAITAVSIGLAVLLLLATFFGDIMQTPGLQVSASRLLFSPNADGTFDILDFNYALQNNAKVTIRVYSNTAQVRTLLQEESQSKGGHFLTWDGRTDVGSVVPDGTYRIEITAQAAIQNQVQTLSAQVDTAPPEVRLVNLNEQARVNLAEMNLEGVTEPGAVIWLSQVAQPMPVDSNGRFFLSLRLQEGENLLNLRAVDPAGNVNEIRRTITLATEGPKVTLATPLENVWTNETVLEIQGETQPGVDLLINEQRVNVGTDGYFRHQMVLTDGANLLHFQAEDELGNITSFDRTVYLKTGANVIELNVEDGAVVAEPSLQLTGKVEPGSAVQINNQAVSVGMLGDFQTSLPLLRGENVIEIQATDQAGNVTRAMRRITYDPQNAQALDLQAVGENFNQAPWLIVPTVVLLGLVLGIVYWRQNRVSLALSVNQSVFVPGGLPGGGANQLEIGLDLSKTARVSLEVLDQQGYPRATLLHNRRKMGRKHLFLWNGMDDQARPLPPGEYTIQAEAGVAPLQVTSALQVRIERPGVSGLGTPIATRQHNLDEVSQRR